MRYSRWYGYCFFVAMILPLFLYWPEVRFDSPRSFSTGPVIVFIKWTLSLLGASLLLSSCLSAFRADGNRPWFLRGSYRYVRNPFWMALAAIFTATGLELGSPGLLAYGVGLSVFWHFFIRPAVEREQENVWGEVYRCYRRRVRCWRPRWRPYDPALEATEPPLAAEATAPPGMYVVLYDGWCRFCTARSRNLLALAKPGIVEAVDFQAPGALERFPGISHASCMQAMYLVTPTGCVYSGFEAAVHALATRPLPGWLAYLYYLPGLRLACDLCYQFIATHRYRIMGKSVAGGECKDGTCSLHGPAR